jgi:phthiocerol/phenolphthiocerol synthesis type-I polyketide synthase E
VTELDHCAIVGMACRFPGARNLQEFWANLVDGVESITFFTEEQLLAAGVDPSEVRNPAYVRAKPALEDYDRFDAAFFGLTRREAELLDPQYRVFLETAYRALEDASCDPARYDGEIAVYGGAGSGPYGWVNLRLNPAVTSRVGLLSINTSANPDYLATQTSYRLDLRGPSMTVQCACSTSLVAVHLACEALRHSECDMALAGGCSIELPQVGGYLHEEGGVESPDGHCRPFDAAAQGTIWGSGAGVVLLKRLGEAIADGDRIYAVVRGTAVNNDGSGKSGFSAPSVQGQTEVIAQALAVAEVSPATISYVEAHGTGTPLGDPIEVRALSEVFRASTPAVQFCGIGSVKSNIGHLSQASGVAGLIKTALALHHGAVPPTINFRRPNPRIDFEGGPFFVNSTLRSWESNGTPRRAAVSAFGIGGTNASAVLEEAPEEEPSGPSRPAQVLTVSARGPAALSAVCAELAQRLASEPELPLADVAHTLALGRRHHAHRRAVVCAGTAAAGALLTKPAGRSVVTGREPARARSVIFVFPGQGAQHVDMGRELWTREPAFGDEVETCARHLEPELGIDLREVLYPGPGQSEAAAARLDRTELTQPALFTVEYALARLLMSWGIEPSAMIGHSIGEYVAACLAGVFPLDVALRLVAARGRLMQALPPGTMLAVQAEPERLEAMLPDGLDLAAVNAPALSVVAGPAPGVEQLEARLAAEDISATRLRTSHAFHSRMMEPVLGEFEELVARAAPGEPRLPFVSNLTGTWITAAEATHPGYWTEQLRRTVRFGAGVAELARQPDRAWIEVGPGRGLTGLVRLQAGRDAIAVPCLRPPRERGSDVEALLLGVAQLWVAGVEVDWRRFWAGERRRRVSLPGYPLERQRFWIEERRGQPTAPAARSGKLPVADWFHVPVWRQTPPVAAGTEAGPWLVFEDDHDAAAGLADRLAELGHRVSRVRPGPGYAALDDGRFTIDAGRRQDYERVLETLAAAGSAPAAIVHAWSVSAPAAGLELGREALERDLRSGFSSLLLLAQALAAGPDGGPVRLTVLTSDAQALGSEAVRRPGRAAVAGPCRVLATELTRVTCREVDIAVPGSAAGLERLTRRLLAEVTRPADGEVLALRDDGRWMRAFERAPLPPAPAGPEAGLRERGVYLITGGLGGIGLALAGELARRARARLALVSRSRLPDRERWAEVRAQNDERAARQVAAVVALEEAGAEVEVLSADVTDARQMREVRDRVLARFGEIHGVVHAAGLPGGGLIEVKSPEQAAAVLAPKVQGAAVLAEVLAGVPLDFVSLCSSVTAVAGGLGQVDYCGANAFLDALARAGAFGDAAVTSVNWGTWLEVGMAAETRVPAGFRELQRGVHAEAVGHPLLTRAERGANDVVFSAEIGPDDQWLLAEHRVQGTPVLPGAAYLELARAAFAHAFGPGPVELRDVDFEAPLSCPDGQRVNVRLVLSGDEESADFRVVSAAGDGWREHARGGAGRPGPGGAGGGDLAAIRARCRLAEQELDGARSAPGMLTLGDHWSSLRRVWRGDGEELGELVCGPEVAGELDRLPLHPALLDEATTFGEVTDPAAAGAAGHLPVAYGRLTLRSALPRHLFSHLRRRPARAGGITAFDLTLLDDSGAVVADVRDFVLRHVSEASLSASLASAEAGGTGADGAGPEAAGILPAEGADAFCRLLAWRPAPQVVATAVDLPTILERARGLTQSSLEEDVEDLQLVSGAGAERLLSTPYAAPRSEVEKQLVGLWAEILGTSLIGVDDDFFALGGNSLVAVQLMARVRSRLGARLPMRSLFEAPTVAQMAQLVEAARRGAADVEEPEIVPVQRDSSAPAGDA